MQKKKKETTLQSTLDVVIYRSSMQKYRNKHPVNLDCMFQLIFFIDKVRNRCYTVNTSYNRSHVEGMHEANMLGRRARRFRRDFFHHICSERSVFYKVCEQCTCGLKGDVRWESLRSGGRSGDALDPLQLRRDPGKNIRGIGWIAALTERCGPGQYVETVCCTHIGGVLPSRPGL